MRSLVGRTVDEFELTAVLGMGAMSVVYQARHRLEGYRLAMKVMRPPPARRQGLEYAERFAAEIETLKRLQGCPHVVRMRAHGVVQGKLPYLVMDLVEGDSLEDVIFESGLLSPAEAFPYVRQLCDALDAIHGRGVVHRDIKPSNVLVEGRWPGRIALIDFGISKQLHGASQLTLGALGSPIFTAPEQVENKRDLVGPQTDLYSLGVLVYTMLSGCEPFDTSGANNALQAMTICLHSDPIPLHRRCPLLPQGLCDLVDECLQRDPHRRPESARALVQRYAREDLGSSYQQNERVC